MQKEVIISKNEKKSLGWLKSPNKQEGNLHHESEEKIRKESVLKHQGAQKGENSSQFEGQVEVKA